eukprot:363429-Chlamydomonas_euryale.AAC.21
MGMGMGASRGPCPCDALRLAAGRNDCTAAAAESERRAKNQRCGWRTDRGWRGPRAAAEAAMAAHGCWIADVAATLARRMPTAEGGSRRCPRAVLPGSGHLDWAAWPARMACSPRAATSAAPRGRQARAERGHERAEKPLSRLVGGAGACCGTFLSTAPV